MPTFRTELHIFRRNTPKVAQPAQSVTVFEPRDRRGAYQQHEHAEAGPHVTATALTRHALALLVVSCVLFSLNGQNRFARLLLRYRK